VQLDLLPGMIIYAALVFRMEVVLLCAAVFGLLFDSLSANLPGTTFTSLAAIGVTASRFREVLLSNQFTTHWVLGLIASAVAPVISVLVLTLSGATPLVKFGSIWHWAIMTAGGGALTPVWFLFFSRLDDALSYKEAPESAFRSDRQIARGRH
jgi:rod shape-determining protein MreD